MTPDMLLRSQRRIVCQEESVRPCVKVHVIVHIVRGRHQHAYVPPSSLQVVNVRRKRIHHPPSNTVKPPEMEAKKEALKEAEAVLQQRKKRMGKRNKKTYTKRIGTQNKRNQVQQRRQVTQRRPRLNSRFVSRKR
jgi:hypothetical protein